MSEIKTNKISPRKGTTQTIGDSGDTVSITCGATLSNAGTISTAGISGGTINNSGGTISGLRGQIEWDTTAKTAAFTAVSNKGYFVNTTSGAITVTFPASPTAGDVIGIKDYANTADTNNITINPNGNNLNGSSINYPINIEGASGEFIYVDATRGWVLTDASKASDIALPVYTVATGGTITTCGDYKIHTFTSPGTFCVSQIGDDGAGGPSSVDYLVVAGGGGTGYGGGGAGGYRESSGAASGCYTISPLGACVAALPVSVTGYPITVGGGGSAGPSGVYSGGGNSGSNSVFSTITSTGGGGGGAVYGNSPGPNAGKSGGSGGGAGFDTSQPTGGAGNTPPVSPPQGQPGGGAPLGGAQVSGGGGGATQAGQTITGQGKGGDGGDGAGTAINPSPSVGTPGPSSPLRYFGGGGAGGANTPGGSPGPASGGTGGGASNPGADGHNGSSGTANTGGGASGKESEGPNGASGGSGIVIIRYKYQ